MADSGLKIDKLAGRANWELWHLRIESLLNEKGYWDKVVSETIEIDDGEDVYNLLQYRSKALAYIRLYLKDRPLLQTRYIKKPNELWTKLKTLYESRGFSSDFLL